MRSGGGDDRPADPVDRQPPVLHNPEAGSHAAAASGGALDGVLELLCAQPQRLEPGLVILDRELVLDDEVMVDVLARDRSGVPVAILFCGADLAQAIGRSAAVLAAVHQGRFLLDRLFGHAGLRAQQRPRFMLIARRFAASRAGDLLQLVGGCDVAVFESQLVRAVDGRPELHLALLARSEFGVVASSSVLVERAPVERTVEPMAAPTVHRPDVVPGELPAGPVDASESSSGSADELVPAVSAGWLPGGGPTLGLQADDPADGLIRDGMGVLGGDPVAPPVADDCPSEASPERLVPVLDDVDLLVRSEASPECRRLCLAARDSIRSLSSLVTQTIEPDRICFLVDNVPLATLIPRGESLQLRVGEEGGPAFDVRDDEGFNASLNAIFSHYFSRFAVRA